MQSKCNLTIYCIRTTIAIFTKCICLSRYVALGSNLFRLFSSNFHTACPSQQNYWTVKCITSFIWLPLSMNILKWIPHPTSWMYVLHLMQYLHWNHVSWDVWNGYDTDTIQTEAFTDAVINTTAGLSKPRSCFVCRWCPACADALHESMKKVF